MARLDAKLFGTPQVTADGRPVSLPYKKADALLYYLLLKRQAPRSELTGLLWPDADSQTALKNLRHAIYSIRKGLGWDPFQGGRRSVLEISPEAEIWCDVSEYLTSGRLELYGGELLKGFSLPAERGFEEWLEGERATLQTGYLRQLLEEGSRALDRGELDRAERRCLDYLEVDPVEENAVVLLMRVCCARRQFRRAIGLYQDLSHRLSCEFGISPLKETTSLYYKIADQWNECSAQPEEPRETLMGKEAALRELLALCGMGAGTRQGPGLLLTGEAGVGKTYLLDHFLSHHDLSGWMVCRGYCYQTEMGGSLAVWNSIIMALVAELELRHIPIPANYARTAAALFPGLAPGREARLTGLDCDFPLQSDYYTALRSVLTIFSIAARKTPILLVFEDIHWMDRSSMELLALFLRRLNHQSAAVVCTARDILPPHMEGFVEEGLRDHVLFRRALRRFTQEETGRFLHQRVDGGLDGDLVERAYHNTGGNALLLAQLADTLAERGELPRIPEDIIAYRLSSLSQDERRVLELVAVFTSWAPFQALSAILRRDPLELTHLCCQLTQKKLLVESTREGGLEYSFTHERIKATVAQQQSESGRRLLHLRVARYLEDRLEVGQTAPYDQLIHHYTAGGDRFRTFRYRVLSLNAYAGLRYELMPTLTADPRTGLSGPDGLWEYFQTMRAELAGLRRFTPEQEELDRLELILLHVESRCCIHDGRYEEGLEVLARLLDCCVQTGDRDMEIQGRLQLVYYGIQTGNSQVMEEHLSIIEGLLRGRERSPEYGVCLRLSGLLELMRGSYPKAREILFQAVQTFQALDPKMDGRYTINIAGAYNYIAETYRLERAYDQAFRYYDQAIAYNRNRGYYPGAALFYTNYGVAAYQNGSMEEAKCLFRYAVELYEESHEYSEYPVALAYLALFDCQEGEPDRAAERLSRALELCDTIGSPRWKGITIYITWKIRELIKGNRCPALEALWPEGEEEHCVWCLSYLRRLQPRMETAEMEQELLRVREEPHQN